jgi:hypothetical protein
MKISVQASSIGGILHLLAFYGVSETQHESARACVPKDVARVEKLLTQSRSA